MPSTLAGVSNTLWIVLGGLIDSGLTGSTDFRASHPQGHGEVPREQKMLKGHLPRVIYHKVY